MQKAYLFSVQIRMQLGNALNSLGYTDTVLFLSIGKPDIYQHKTLGTVRRQQIFIRVFKSLKELPINIEIGCQLT
jgi:hypothetical protein